jgi:hypothetical protein
MTTGYYRLTVVVCVLSWFMVGLHFPIVHEMIDHGRRPDNTVLTVVSLLTVIAAAGLWLLLSAPRQWATRAN